MQNDPNISFLRCVRLVSCVILQKKLAALQTLELFNCDVAQAEGYRDKIFEMLESVLYVDGFDRDGEPAPDEDEVDDYDGEGKHNCSCRLFNWASRVTAVWSGSRRRISGWLEQDTRARSTAAPQELP